MADQGRVKMPNYGFSPAGSSETRMKEHGCYGGKMKPMKKNGNMKKPMKKGY